MCRIVSVATVSLLIAGCSTAPVVPKIATFSNAVATTTEAVKLRFDSEKLEQKRLTELDKAIVEQRASYSATCTAPISLSIAIDDPALSDYSKHCALGLKKLENGQLVRVHVEAPDGGEGVDGYNARRLSLALGNYAASLKTLAESNAPSEVAPAFQTAVASLLALAQKTGEAKGQPPLTDKDIAALTAGTDVVATGLTEALEAYRYRLLKTLVTKADPTVKMASRAVAGWFWLQEEPTLVTKYEALDDALSAQQVEIGKLNAGRGDRVAAEKATANVRAVYDNLAQSETSTGWQTHLAIARAHHAIRVTLESDLSLETLAAANDRIADLAQKAKTFFDAIEAR